MQFKSQVQRQYHVSLNLLDLFEQPTIAAIAVGIDKQQRTSADDIDEMAALLAELEES